MEKYKGYYISDSKDVVGIFIQLDELVGSLYITSVTPDAKFHSPHKFWSTRLVKIIINNKKNIVSVRSLHSTVTILIKEYEV